jgi:hypothetical protein
MFTALILAACLAGDWEYSESVGAVAPSRPSAAGPFERRELPESLAGPSSDAGLSAAVHRASRAESRISELIHEQAELTRRLLMQGQELDRLRARVEKSSYEGSSIRPASFVEPVLPSPQSAPPVPAKSAPEAVAAPPVPTMAFFREYVATPAAPAQAPAYASALTYASAPIISYGAYGTTMACDPVTGQCGPVSAGGAGLPFSGLGRALFGRRR